jgi:hypothetical protein
MRSILSVAAVAVSLLVWLLVSGCDVETNQNRALYAKHNASIRRLLVSLELYKSQKGTLPASLQDLRAYDVQIRDISISEYTYSPSGIIVADHSRWLLAVSSPLHTNEVIVGKLPIEVTVKASR